MSGFPTSPLSDAQADQILAAIKPTLRIAFTSATRVEPGQVLTASLVPASPEIDASNFVNGALNLALSLKDVIFAGPTVTDVPAAGEQGDTVLTTVGSVTAQPFPPAAPVIGGVATQNPAGLLGQLFGGVALPDVRVQVDLTWVVLQNGGELTEGSDFIAPRGLASPDVSVAVPPAFRELRLDTMLNPIGEVYCLLVRGNLRLGARSLPFTVGPLPFLALPIFVPTVVALFSQPSFGLTHDGAVAILVPEHSPFASAEALFKVLRQVESVLGSLRSLAKVAAWLLGVSELVSSVPDQPRIRFVASNQVAKLGSIKIKRRPWYNLLGSDPNFDDQVSSLFVLGLPGTEVEFFNDTNFKRRPASNQGMFSLRTNFEGWVAVRDLDTSNDERPRTSPRNTSDNRYVPEFENDSTGDSSWVTDMSSVRFLSQWVKDVENEISNPPQPPALDCKPLVIL